MTVQVDPYITALQPHKWADSDADTFDREEHLAGPVQNIGLHRHIAGEGRQIPTGGIEDLAINTAKLAALAVTTAKIAALAVTASELAANAVTTAKILDGALSADATGRAKMADGFVNTAKLADDAVTIAKLAADVDALLATFATITSVQTLTNKELQYPKINTQYGEWASVADGATVTFDMTVANRQRVTLGGNRTLAVTGTSEGQVFLVRLQQDATGSRLATWFAGISWAGGVAPTLTTAANKADEFIFVRTGLNTYDGHVVGQNI